MEIIRDYDKYPIFKGATWKSIPGSLETKAVIFFSVQYDPSSERFRTLKKAEERRQTLINQINVLDSE